MPQVVGTFVPPKLASAPASPVSGQIYYDTTLNMVLYYNGTAWVRISKPPTRTILSTAGSGTYTTPAGCLAIQVECIGGGGGGGGCPAAASGAVAGASGGGGGAYAASLISSPAATYAYTVGAGGTGGVAGANAGVAGGDTTFGSTVVVAKGGGAGLAGTTSGTFPFTLGSNIAGGAAASCTGDIRVSGQGANPGYVGSATAIFHPTGGKAAGPYSGPVTTWRGAVNGAGTAGENGSGGDGGKAINGGVAQAGGNGGNGIIVVTEYYG